MLYTIVVIKNNISYRYPYLTILEMLAKVEKLAFAFQKQRFTISIHSFLEERDK